MNKLKNLLIAAAFVSSLSINAQTVNYPVTKKTDVVNDYHGVKVADPYRWLEDDNSAETKDWVKAENKVTRQYLDAIPFRNKIRERLEKIWNFPKYGTPHQEGKYIIFSKNDGMQNQSILYIQEGLTGTPRVLLDPNKISNNGTAALGEYAVSNDGKYFAYSVAKAGSDWNDIYVMEVETGKLLTDQIKWVKFSGISWHGDGFYYSAYDAPKKGEELSKKNEFHKIYFHKVGTSQDKDQLIYKNDNFPLRNYGATVTNDEQYLIMSETAGTSGNALYVKNLKKENADFIKVAEGFDFDYGVVENIKGKLLVHTNDGASRYRLILIDPEKPARENWTTVINEEKNVLQSAVVVGGHIIATYMKDVSNKSVLFSIDGKMLHEIATPGIGTISGFTGKPEDKFSFYSFASFTMPTTIFRYDVAKNSSAIFSQPKLDFSTTNFETRQVFYTSKDGTKVPMFIVHKKGLKLDGKNPVYLYGYGGFNISLTPAFSAARMIWLEKGGVLAIPNLRGGGEYGEEWHKAGTLLQKQNVFDDFISAAEYLIKQNYTNSSKLVIAGGSNGGLLVGACMTQRPDLFKVALPAVGVMDMLRFHKFTIGWAWTGDYGSSDDAEQFKYILKYSPLHNLKAGVHYPATLVTTADHDDRVVPAHSFKFAATLQEKHVGENPVLIRIETEAGHGAGKPTSKQIDEWSDVWSFTFKNLGLNY
ncbi:MAG: S9 family peptidase [Bacteroidetes bacterium]|nr:S9 family peptidase [Bacteroidota bacterium]